MLLEVEALRTQFFTEESVVKAIDGVSFNLSENKTLGIVGESGCGKSATALSLMRLLPSQGRVVGGRVLFDGKNILDFSQKDLRLIRGNQMAMIFQEPMTSLNPVFTVGYQIAEALRAHTHLRARRLRDRSVELLKWVGIPDPQNTIDDYPHQLSGGMRQRVVIAMAISCHPKLLIADEPTTALDVTIQAQILELLKRLQKETGMAILIITHDLGIVAEVADEVMVMYAGRVVEGAGVGELFRNPMHPYTRGLLESLPKLNSALEKGRLKGIGGMVPNLANLPKGCSFEPRCQLKKDHCKQNEPLLEEKGPSHKVSCFEV